MKALKKGNHKSAQRHMHILHKNIQQEVSHGFQFPFHLSIINKIPHSVVSPYGIAKQSTYNDRMERVPKYRTTHDL